jgi:hypothetical protein
MDYKYAGMTVNERLFVSGLVNEFYNAVNKKDSKKVRQILKDVELTEGNIVPILEHFGLSTKNEEDE